MSNQKISTEELIYKAAEEEFIERGYDGAKMMSIAKRAGVSHSMLHYYYRSKEQLFQQVIAKCSLNSLPALNNILEPDGISFLERTRLLVEHHFAYLRKNPRLLFFLIETIALREKNREQFFGIVGEDAQRLVQRLEELINEAIDKKEIRPIKTMHYLMNLASLNSSSFIALPILKQSLGLESEEQINAYLQERCEQNVLFMQHALRFTEE